MHIDPKVRLGLLLGADTGPEAATPVCLDDETIAALAEGRLSAAVREVALPHLAACARCRSAVASVARALADPAVARAARAAQAGDWNRVYRIGAIALPAAAALVLLLARPWAPEGPPRHRAPTITAAPSPAPASPVGLVSEARAFRWAPVPAADRYRVTLFDAEGRVVYEAEVTAATAALPDTVALVPGTRYLWKVEARTGFDRWASSELVEFSIARGPPR